MKTAKLFLNGNSQAVRLPKDFRFTGKEVYIKKIGGMVVMVPKDALWESFYTGLNMFTDDLMNERKTLEVQDRPGL